MKTVGVGLAAFVFFFIIFREPLNMQQEAALMGALAGAVLVAFLWTKLSPR